MAGFAGKQLGRYEIGALIGAGGMGEVYRAHDPNLRRDVAVKVLPERLGADGERQRRFEREARAAAELEHPNIVAVHDVGVDDGVPFIVTELLDGGTLAEALRHGPLPRARAVEIAVQIARGVAAAHEKGIVHRDLKPSNVFLCPDGRVKILDFGLAAHVESPGADDTVTETGAILGTPAYMSPEQVRGQRADVRADLFAVGTILYEMLSGRRPFAAESPVEVAHAILTEEPEPLEDPALDAIVRLCIAKDPAARLCSANDLALLLTNVPSPRQAAPAPRSRRVWLLALAGGLVAAVALGWAVWPTRVTPAPRYTRITFHEGGSAAGRFAPDGRTVLYTAFSLSEKPLLRGRVFATTPGRPEARPLAEPGTWLVAVSATGDMLLSVGHPMAKHVLARVALAGGVPRVLYDDVESADFSPDGSELAIVRSAGGQQRLEYPVGHVIFTTPFHITCPRVSPRGDQVGFILWSDFLGSSVWDTGGTVEIVGRNGARKTLSRPWSVIFGLAWAPDGSEVWVTGRRATYHSLYALSLDGHEREVLALPSWLILHDIARDGRVLLAMDELRMGIRALVPGNTAETPLGRYDQSIVTDLSPDGRLILFTSGGESSQERGEAFVRRTDGSPAVDLGPGSTYALSPDGAWALVGPAAGQQSSLALVPTGAGEARPLPSGAIGQHHLAYFFADGQRIALVAREAAHRMRLWVQDTAGGDPRPISDEGIAMMARPAPQGDGIPACRDDGTCALFPVAGGAPRPLPPLRSLGWPLQVTPDGQSLVVGRPYSLQDPSRGPDRPALWRVDLATGSERLLRELPMIDQDVVSNWDLLRLTPDASAYAYTYMIDRSDLVVVEGLH